MSYLLPFIGIVFIASFTPGPNNSMLLQSGISFGYKKTIPHILGIIIGFNILFISINLGLYAIIQKFEILLLIIKIIGTLYFSYFAYKLITAPLPIQKPTQGTAQVPIKEPMKEPAKERIPFTLMQAILFQWINVKAWFFSIAAISVLPTQRTLFDHILIQIVIIFFTIASASTWTVLGVVIQSIFKHPLYFRIINVMLGLILFYAGVSPWFPQ